jgi:TRAP-type C4-dicarboxylate transport system substrate-binding protein
MLQRALAPALFLVTLALVGCSAGSDKAGGSAAPDAAHEKVVLRLAIGTAAVEVNGFANEVARLTGGSVEVVAVDAWRLGQPRFERGLIADVRSGKADLGAVASRAWDSVGVMSFRALGAPLLVDSFALQERVLESPLSPEMLAGLKGSGLIGVGLLPGELRRPLGARRPLLGPSDYRGLRIGLQESRAGLAALRALGARPVLMSADQKGDGLDGFEFHLIAPSGETLDRRGNYLTANVVLWPRPLVIFTTQRTLARLTSAQRDALRQAAANDTSAETRFLASFERAQAAVDCTERRLRFVTAPPAAVAALRRAVRPVYGQLERDPPTRRFIVKIERIRRELGAPVSTVPRCSGAVKAVVAAVTPVDGEYRVTARPVDLPAAARAPEQQGTWRVVLDRGRFRLSLDGDAATWNADGAVRVSRDTMTWTVVDALDWGPHGTPNGVPIARGDKIVFRWRRTGHSLALSSKPGPLPGLSVHPLQRVGDAPGQRPLQKPAALEGVWATNVTAADWLADHLDPGGIPGNTGPLRLTLHGSRCRWTQQAPHGFYWGSGICRFAGDTLEFDQTQTDVGPGAPLYWHWSVFHDRLTFRLAPGVSPQTWTYHPWRRVR